MSFPTTTAMTVTAVRYASVQAATGRLGRTTWWGSYHHIILASKFFSGKFESIHRTQTRVFKKQRKKRSRRGQSVLAGQLDTERNTYTHNNAKRPRNTICATNLANSCISCWKSFTNRHVILRRSRTVTASASLPGSSFDRVKPRSDPFRETVGVFVATGR